MYHFLYLIFKSYASLFCIIGSIGIVIFLGGCWWLVKLQSVHSVNREKQVPPEKEFLSASFSDEDIAAIAGDELLITQLDLARAYLELGHIDLAKTLLHNICAKGTIEQRKAAEMLLLSKMNARV